MVLENMEKYLMEKYNSNLRLELVKWWAPEAKCELI